MEFHILVRRHFYIETGPRSHGNGTGKDCWIIITVTSYEHDGVTNHQPHNCLLNRLFRRRSKKTSKLRVTGLCEGSPMTGEFSAQRTSNAENVSIWWSHRGLTGRWNHDLHMPFAGFSLFSRFYLRFEGNKCAWCTWRYSEEMYRHPSRIKIWTEECIT